MRLQTTPSVPFIIIILLLISHFAARAQFFYVINSNTITITGYNGSGAVTIPDNINGLPVKTIGNSAFYGNGGITSIAISSNVTTISAQAFTGCSGLQTLAIPSGVVTIGDRAFCNCYYLTNVTIAGTVSTIGNFAFQLCYRLSNLTISNGVTSILGSAFQSCYNLPAVTIPSSVTSISEDAFSVCKVLQTITVDSANPSYSSSAGVLYDKSQVTLVQYPAGKTGSFSIPATVRKINARAFSGCIGVTDLTLSGAVTNIGSYAFVGCQNLAAIDVNATNSVFSSVAGVLLNKSQTILLQCPLGKVLGDYAVPATVKTINDSAFQYCGTLTNLMLPQGLTSIGVASFEFCSNLSTINLPNSVTNLGSYAFDSCYAVTNLVLSTNLTTIAQQAFGGLTSLTSFVVPRSVTNIVSDAFDYCSSLQSVYFLGNAPTIGAPNFYTVTGATAYYVTGAIGWGSTFAGLPTALWKTTIQSDNGSFGIVANAFGFTVSGTANIPIAIDACPNLHNPSWVTVQSCTLTNGLVYFADPAWTNSPVRLYRIRSR